MSVLCPYCRSKVIRRSKRRGVVESSILSLISVRPFRCKECDRRFYSFISRADLIHFKSRVPHNPGDGQGARSLNTQSGKHHGAGEVESARGSD